MGSTGIVPDAFDTQRTIVIEARDDDNVSPIMDAMTDVCSALGHRVLRWRGPIAGSKRYCRKMPPCDVAILFNGTHKKYQRVRQQLTHQGSIALFVELGWFPQMGTIQVDLNGINCEASWSGTTLKSPLRNRLPVGSGRDLLLLLQDDKDTQITRHSPWFANMAEFVSHIARFSNLPVRVRSHPRRRTGKRVTKLLREFGLEQDRSRLLADALAGCKAVACINSSGGVEALAQRIPVLCYGSAIYRHEGAVYCLNNQADDTSSITRSLREGVCELYQDRVDEVVQRIRTKQWLLEDIPIQLPELLNTVFALSSPNAGQSVSTRTHFLSRAFGRLANHRNAA